MPWEKQFDVEQVLETAMQAFWARGYQATSMQNLVDCTGVNRASLYATYGDKHALFLAALQRYDETRRRALFAELEDGIAPRQAIRRLFELFAGPAIAGEERRGCFLTNTALELAAHDDDACRIVAGAQREIEGFFARMVARAIASGEAQASLVPAEAARGLLSALLGLVVLSRSRPEPGLLRAIVEEAMKRLD